MSCTTGVVGWQVGCGLVPWGQEDCLSLVHCIVQLTACQGVQQLPTSAAAAHAAELLSISCGNQTAALQDGLRKQAAPLPCRCCPC